MDYYLTLLSFGDKGWGDELARGALITIGLALATLPFGLALGLLVALLKRSDSSILRGIGTVYMTVFRGLPELLTLYIVYFGTAARPAEGVEGRSASPATWRCPPSSRA